METASKEWKQQQARLEKELDRAVRAAKKRWRRLFPSQARRKLEAAIRQVDGHRQRSRR